MSTRVVAIDLKNINKTQKKKKKFKSFVLCLSVLCIIWSKNIVIELPDIRFEKNNRLNDRVSTVYTHEEYSVKRGHLQKIRPRSAFADSAG